MVDLLIAAVVGGLIGWLASIIMRTEEGPLASILIGVIGAALGRWLFGDVLGFGGALSAGAFSLSGLFWGIVGAVILIAILRFFRVMGSPR